MSYDAHDVGAEQALLGAVLAAPAPAAPALLAVPAEAWYRPIHGTIAAVLTGRLHRGQSIDLQLVLTDLLARHGFGSETGPYLVTLLERAWNVDHAPDYAARILHCAARRNLAGAADQLTQRLERSWAAGGNEPITRFTTELREAADAADAADAGVDADVESPSLTELLNGQDTHDWLVPGLLERGERIILTGTEGLGKSWMCSQFAVCLAAGLHPFTGQPLGSKAPSLRVLVIDCENGVNQSRRRFRRITRRLPDDRGWRDNLRLEIRPAGLDLLGRDASWLEQRVATNAPDLLVIGPLYRLHFGNMNDELPARQLVAVLDGVRARHGCALLSEAHAGHERDSGTGARRLRPTGSSLFLRWPEFGFGLTAAKGAEGEHPALVDVVAWRGSREERQWPRQLRHGSFLPWEAEGDDYWQEAG